MLAYSSYLLSFRRCSVPPADVVQLVGDGFDRSMNAALAMNFASSVTVVFSPSLSKGNLSSEDMHPTTCDSAGVDR